MFSQPDPFTFGTTGRTLPDVREPGVANFDFSVQKNVSLAERLRMQFRGELFNIFNTPQFGRPGTTFGTPQFGVISSQANSPRQIQFVRSLLPNLRQVPGVENAAAASDLPATGAGSVPIHIKGQPEPPSSGPHTAVHVVVTPDYFQAVGVPLLRGRSFAEYDDATAPRVLVVNQEFVHKFLQDRDPLGTRIQLDINGASPGTSTAW